MGKTDAFRLLEGLAASQWGMATAVQAVRNGIEPDVFFQLADKGQLEHLGHGVYRTAGVPADRFEGIRAAWLSLNPKLTAKERCAAAHPDEVVSGATAAHLLGASSSAPEPFEFTVLARQQAQRGEFVFRVRRLPADGVMIWDGLPVTTPAQTVVDLLVRAGADQSLLANVASVVEGLDREKVSSLLADFSCLTSQTEQTAQGLQSITPWLATLGLTEQAIAGAPLPFGSSKSASLAQKRLFAPGLLNGREAGLTLAERLDEAIIELDSRLVYILSRRLFAEKKATLEQVGQELGITRERVRQLEIKAKEAFHAAIEPHEFLHLAASVFRESDFLVRPLDEVLSQYPAFAETVISVQQPAWRILYVLDSSVEIADGWCAKPTIASAKEATLSWVAEHSNGYGAMDLAEVTLLSSLDLQRSIDIRAAWLKYCGLAVADGIVCTQTRSVGDYAAAVLSVVGEPLSPEEIVGLFAYKRDSRSLANQLSADPRFERAGRETWALKEWGLEVYTGIRGEIKKKLDKSGGPIYLTDLISELTVAFGVSETSVKAYAGAPPFQCKDGVVSSIGPCGLEATKAPGHTKKFYRMPDAWVYRIRVTSDHLRGSGMPAPMAVATLLCIRFGQTVQLESELGLQKVAWTGISPTLGSIRRLLVEYGIKVGAEVFLAIRDDGTFRCISARPLIGDPLADALALIGAPEVSDAAAARKYLAEAVCLPEESSVEDIVGAYRQRGDADVALLLEQVHPVWAGA
ncbi:MAG: hypothetical protein FWE94_01770 [Coriobacteriia bacterium]|nr:hypothetical protein [Coriobacteriia bacterium]